MKGIVCLEKQESLELLKIEGVKFKELILSDTNPFPGYYSIIPGEEKNKPKYAFALIKQGEGCYEDKVLRTFYKIKKEVDFNFDANYGRITIHNKTKPCIRFTINDFSKVQELILLFKNEGIKFQKSENVNTYKSNIKIRKFISFKEFAENIYTGNKENHYYIKVNRKQKWDEFAKTILSIKATKEFKTFDAAQTSLYTENEIIEFVRIYTESFKKEDFIKLRNEIIKHI